MTQTIQGRVALVTGASSGIGEQAALRLSKAGFTGYAVARRVERMAALEQAGVVNISSIGARFYEPLGAWYHATKFAVEGFSDSLRIELAPFGIDVVLIEPGPIRTEWSTISRESLTGTSRGGAYEQMGTSVRAVLERADSSRLMSSGPGVVARKIVKAATSRNPRARYPVGRNAGTILFARRVLPDRVFDAIVTRMYLPTAD